MPNPEADALFSKYLDISVNKMSYCGVCMRTEIERNLVIGKWLKKIRAIMKMMPQEDEMVCAYCEQHAMNAVKLFKTMHCARILTNVINNFKGKRVSKREFIKRLVNFKSVKKNGEKNKLDYNNLLNIVRKQCNFTKSVTLNLDAVLDGDSVLTTISSHKSPSEVIIVPDIDSLESLPVNQDNLIPMDGLESNNTPKLESIPSILPDKHTDTVMMPTMILNPLVVNYDDKNKRSDDDYCVLSKEIMESDKRCAVFSGKNAVDVGNGPDNGSDGTTVDWDERIPKDVICVMESEEIFTKCTSTNILNSQLLPGNITEVRTLTDSEYNRNMVSGSRQQHNEIDIIDLC